MNTRQLAIGIERAVSRMGRNYIGAIGLLWSSIEQKHCILGMAIVELGYARAGSQVGWSMVGDTREVSNLFTFRAAELNNQGRRWGEVLDTLHAEFPEAFVQPQRLAPVAPASPPALEPAIETEPELVCV